MTLHLQFLHMFLNIKKEERKNDMIIYRFVHYGRQIVERGGHNDFGTLS